MTVTAFQIEVMRGKMFSRSQIQFLNCHLVQIQSVIQEALIKDATFSSSIPPQWLLPTTSWQQVPHSCPPPYCNDWESQHLISQWTLFCLWQWVVKWAMTTPTTIDMTYYFHQQYPDVPNVGGSLLCGAFTWTGLESVALLTAGKCSIGNFNGESSVSRRPAHGSI